jgi:hypothetical protein
MTFVPTVFDACSRDGHLFDRDTSRRCGVRALEKMGCLGYQWLCERFRLSAFPLTRPARLAPVSRLTRTGEALLVPASAAPDADRPLDQILFALMHEGVNLQVLAQALKQVPASVMQRRGSAVSVAACCHGGSPRGHPAERPG